MHGFLTNLPARAGGTRLATFLTLALVAACGVRTPPSAGHGSVAAPHAMVVSAHPEATRIGVEVLRAGGNATDAAVAVQFALAVCLPVAGNIGGGGFVVYRQASGIAGALDFRETAPATATRDMYLDAQGNPLPGASVEGVRAAGVPGTVAGMVALHEKLGHLPWAAVVAPAVALARRGVALTPKETAMLNGVAADLRRLNTDHRPYLLRDNPMEPWKVGDTLKMPALAATLQRIQEQKSAGFYQGATADAIVAAMKSRGGLISHEDLLAYRPIWRDALRGRYRDVTVLTMPPPSSGGVALLQLLSLLQPFDLKALGWQKAPAVHRICEAERRVYADRAIWLGDPAFTVVPVQNLLDTAYLRRRWATFRADTITPSNTMQAGRFTTVPESDQTTHYSIVDAEGNAIACTTTLNGAYGAKVVVKDGGFLLNNEMDDFSVKPGVPNSYGVTGGTANAIQPGKRMLSSMTPTILERDGRLWAVLGTPGGSTIITSVLQTVLALVDYGYDAQTAVSQPRFHHQWLPPDQIRLEKGALTGYERTKLGRMGWTLVEGTPIGRVDIIVRRPDGQWSGGADPRGDDTAGGY